MPVEGTLQYPTNNTPRIEAQDDGLDDIQRFRLRMNEVQGLGKKQAHVSLPVQSTNIFDVLEQLDPNSTHQSNIMNNTMMMHDASVDKEFEAMQVNTFGKKSKFDKLFTGEKEREIQSSSLDVSKGERIVLGGLEMDEEEEVDLISKMVSSSIQGKKNHKTKQ